MMSRANLNNNLTMYRQNVQKIKLVPEDFLENTFSEYLSCHPTYMIPLIRAHNFIMRDLGPLNPVFRYYIGIMAASRHRCAFLINLCKKEYLFHGGDPEWLKNNEKAPMKLRVLNAINKVLAHQPWLFSKAHIEALAKGPAPWTLSELTHAIVIMSHFHALCTLAFGCKFGWAEPENFDEEDSDYEEVEIEELQFDGNGSQKIKKIVKRSPASRQIIERCRQLELENASLAEFVNFKSIHDKKSRQKGNKGKGGGNAGKRNKGVKGPKGQQQGPVESDPKEQEEATKENTAANGNQSGSIASTSTAGSCESLASSPGSSGLPMTNPMTSSQESTTSDELEVPSSTAAASSSDEVTVASDQSTSAFQANTWNEDEWRKHGYEGIMEDSSFAYTDFAARGRPSEVSTFRIQDFQWEDQGFSLCNVLYPDIGPFLDEKFKVGYNLTYYTLGPKTNIDTSLYRRAIWNYIQCIYGVRHDDYNYREVNILLERNLKCYIKTLACYPDRIPKTDFSGVLKGFRASEKIHVIIMVAEARFQSEILYAMRTLTTHMKVM